MGRGESYHSGMSINPAPAPVSPYRSPASAPLAGAPPSKPGGVAPPPIMHPHHMNAFAMQSMSENNVWAFIMFGIICAGLVKLLAGHGWQGSLMLLFATSFLLATYYAKRPRIQHRLAKVLCALFFVTFRNSTTRRITYRYLRTSATFAVSILCACLFLWN